MNCQELEPWLSAYEDGELDPRRRRTVEAHLACCPNCRALCQGWADLARDLRVSLARREAPESLHSRVMRQIPEPVVSHGKRRSPGGAWRWLSITLAPAAVAASLLWGPHPISRTPPTVFRPGAAPPIEAMNTSLPMGPAIQLALPGDPSLLRLVTATRPATAPREQRKKPIRRSVPVPAAGTGHAGKAQGRRPSEGDALRHLRHLRPARVRYRLAESFGAERRRARRWRPWRTLAARPSLPHARPAVAADDLPRIHVVEYVLPALAPAEPAPVVEAGLNL